MNAANLCPSPRSVADRVSELTRDIDHDCSFQNRGKFGDLREGARGQVAAQLGVTADELALVRNTSEANNIVNAGVVLGKGDEVLLWDQNHPTNNVAWDVRAARYGCSRCAGSRSRRTPAPAKRTSRRPSSTPSRREYEGGGDHPRLERLRHSRLPVRRIADAAHERGIHVHVDGAQSFGGLSVDIPAIGADTFTSSSHKWFCGPKECGVLVVRSEFIPKPVALGGRPRLGRRRRSRTPAARGSSSPWDSATTPVSRRWAPPRNSTARSGPSRWKSG